MEINKLTLESVSWPGGLREIASPPQQLYVSGTLKELLSKPRLAVVGSRKVTAYGRAVTQQLVGECARAGVVIVSGLALGVDSIAHQTAIDTGGYTVAVLPSGLDKIYPASHKQLAKTILQKNGALVSEYPEGTPPLKQHFIARNRLVAGLADAVLITEAAERSGTLHTANFALEQGKTVMAVPGNITSPYSVGTNNLIKAGALPITSADDIFTALGISQKARVNQEVLGATAEETLLLKLLAAGLTDASELLTKSGMEASTFNQALTMLEINGQIKPLGAGHWTLS